MLDSRFTAGAAQCVYVVPRDHRAPDDVRRRGDVVLRERLPSACGRLLESTVAPNGDAVWLIDRLDVAFAFPGDAIDDAQLAELWSQAILRSLSSAVRRGTGVIRFPTRAAFVAQYIADAAAGCDRGAWYYAQFDSLDALPVAAKVREALVREPELAFAIFVELARRNRIFDVLAVLTGRGAEEVWEVAFPAPEVCEPSARVFEVLLAEWEEAVRWRGTHLGLRLVAAAIAALGDELADARVLRAHADALLLLASAGSEVWALVEALQENDLATAAARVWRADVSSAAPVGVGGRDVRPPLYLLAKLAKTRPELITCAASTLHVSTPKMPEDTMQGSAFAGLALLLRDVPESLDPAVRVLVAAACAGVDVLDVQVDPIARLFSGAERADETSVLLFSDQLDEEIAHLAREVLLAFSRRLPGFANSSAPFLRENFLAGYGAIRFTREAIEVRLPRVPLALVLRIAGAHRTTFTLPWLPEQTVTLLLPEEA